MNRRQALVAGGLGVASMGMPGSVMGSDKLDKSGNAVSAEKSCIFVLLCGGPSHVDTWDMKPNASEAYRGPYKPIPVIIVIRLEDPGAAKAEIIWLAWPVE